MSFTPENFTVWAEIPVTDLDRAIVFYDKVFNTALTKDESGPQPMAIFPTLSETGVAAHLYAGKPAGDGAGPTIHMVSPDTVEAALERVKTAGGKVLSDIISISCGQFAYCLDPDGNSIGIYSH
jgi:predicted enzyme related to lactoylglutathione lyase